MSRWGVPCRASPVPTDFAQGLVVVAVHRNLVRERLRRTTELFKVPGRFDRIQCDQRAKSPIAGIDAAEKNSRFEVPNTAGFM